MEWYVHASAHIDYFPGSIFWVTSLRHWHKINQEVNLGQDEVGLNNAQNHSSSY